MARIKEFVTGSYQIETEVINSHNYQLHVKDDFVGVYNTSTRKYVSGKMEEFSDWLDTSGTPYGSLALLMSDLNTFFPFFFDVGSAILAYSGIYDNYADLIANETAGTAGRLFYVIESQGTSWLPSTLGGTFYPAGAYLDTGAAFVSDRNLIADQLEDLTKSQFLKEVVIKSVDDFPLILQSDVSYLLDGVIDLGTRELIVPEGGLVIKGHDYFISGLKSTEDNHVMFAKGVGNYTGNLKLGELFITSSGLNSKVFGLDNEQNSGAVEISSCNIGDFSDLTTSLGELRNYRQFRTQDCGFFRVQDGLLFGGTWSGGFRINDTIVLAQAANSTLFKPEIGLTFAGRCISDINAASVDPTTITFDFDEANFLLDAGFQLTGASFAPNSSISVTTDETSIKAFFRDCVEIRNTRAGYQMEWTVEALNTLDLNVFEKAEGTTVTTKNTWFTQTGNNEVTYNSSLIKDLWVSMNITVDGGANDDIAIRLRKWDNANSVYVDVKTKTKNISNIVGGLDVTDFTFIARVDDVRINDRVEIWIANTTDGTDATVKSASEVIVEVI